jgi:hypothetical protein
MKTLDLTLSVAVLSLALAGLAGCTAIYDDTGSADPSSPWTWVCPDGAVPESGSCLADASAEASRDAGAMVDAGPR